MPAHRWASLRWRHLLLLVALGSLSGAESPGKGYSPVAPPSAVHAALGASLKTVEEFLKEKDFASANQYTAGLTTLAHLYSYQGSQPAWRDKALSLSDTCSRLATSVRAKDAPASARLVQESGKLLADLAKTAPGAPGGKEFRPQGNVRTWMLLVDAAHSDARTARSPAEMESLAQAIAEEANAFQYLRGDERWRQLSLDVRASALSVAGKAKEGDLAGAKTALKAVYRACESCHDRARKK